MSALPIRWHDGPFARPTQTGRASSRSSASHLAGMYHCGPHASEPAVRRIRRPFEVGLDSPSHAMRPAPCHHRSGRDIDNHRRGRPTIPAIISTVRAMRIPSMHDPSPRGHAQRSHPRHAEGQQPGSVSGTQHDGRQGCGSRPFPRHADSSPPTRVRHPAAPADRIGPRALIDRPHCPSGVATGGRPPAPVDMGHQPPGHLRQLAAGASTGRRLLPPPRRWPEIHQHPRSLLAPLHSASLSLLSKSDASLILSAARLRRKCGHILPAARRVGQKTFRQQMTLG